QDTNGETWEKLNNSLMNGLRGLAGGSSLARLLAAERGKRNPVALPSLTECMILSWADAFHARTGRWPTENSGQVAESPGDTWNMIANAMRFGRCGLGIGSFSRLLERERGVPYRSSKGLPPLTVEQILAWADEHHSRTGNWPSVRGGAIPGTG